VRIHRSHRNRGYLGFVAHLGEEERDQRGSEHTEMFGNRCFFLLDLVRDYRPASHTQE
jgi:hypothetical protein